MFKKAGKKTSRVLAYLLALMVVVGCFPSTLIVNAMAAVVETYTVTVVDNNSTSIEGVLITVYDAESAYAPYCEAVTDSSGKAVFTQKFEEGKAYLFDAQKVGYDPNEYPEVTMDSSTTELTITMQDLQRATISGVVQDENNINYEGATVTLKFNGDIVDTDTTNENGEYSLNAYKNQNYTLIIEPRSGEEAKYKTINESNVGAISDSENLGIKTLSIATYAVNVVASENCTLKFYDDEQNELNNAALQAISYGSSVTVEVIPTNNDDYRLKSFAVTGCAAPVLTDGKYTFTVNGTTEVSAAFEQYLFAVTGAGSTAEGTVAFEGVTNNKAEIGSTIKVNVNAAEGYCIDTLTITNGAETVDTQSAPNQTEFPIESLEVKGAVDVRATFKPITYNIEFTVGTNGKVTYNNGVTDVPVGAVETVEHNDGTYTFKATATGAGYHVEKIEIKRGGELDSAISLLDGTNADNEIEKTIENIRTNITVNVEFAINTYNITLNREANTNGVTTVDNAVVNYGSTATVTIQPDVGYSISSVKIKAAGEAESDVTDSVTTDDGSTFKLQINNIEKDYEVIVNFAENETINLSNIEWNSSDALRSFKDENGVDSYIFAPGTVTFENIKSGVTRGVYITDTANNTKKVFAVAGNDCVFSITDTINIAKIEIFNDVKRYTIVDDSNNPIKMNIIFDKTTDSDALTLTPPALNDGYTVYKDPVTVDITGKDSLSGIESIKYFVTSTDTEIDASKNYDAVLADANITKAVAETGVYAHTSEIKTTDIYRVTIGATGEFVTLWVKLVDRAGNETYKRLDYSVNTIAPTIAVTIGGTPVTTEDTTDGEKGYYNATRTATITVTDKDYTFNENGLTLNIIAKDKAGNTIRNLSTVSTISNWVMSAPGVYTRTVTFAPGYEYEWSVVSYKSKAQTVTAVTTDPDANTVWNFVVDNTAPTGTLKYNLWNDTWNTLLTTITFGLFTNNEVAEKLTYSVTATDDDISGVASVKYFVTNESNALLATDLDSKAFEDAPVIADEEQKLVVYAKITDKAGNYCYINADGVIVDKSELDITFAPPTLHSGSYYNKDFEIPVSVVETGTQEELQSGIETISYKIVKEVNNTKITTKEETILFANSNKALTTSKDVVIPVDADDNNSNNVEITVYATDRAGNTKEETIAVAIDSIKPFIKPFVFTDTKNPGDDVVAGHYTSRVATITIIEKNFDPANTQIEITAKNAAGDDVAFDKSVKISGWTHNGDTHTATVTFDVDANYTLKVTSTDLAGNPKETSVCSFVVDNIAPTGKIKIDNNVWETLLNVITFNFSQVEKVVSAEDVKDVTCEDTTIQYFKTNNPILLTDDELAGVTWVAYNDTPFKVSPNEQFVVYLKLTDAAGNYRYICSEGYILDTVSSDVKISASTPSGKNIVGTNLYNGDVEITAKVTDAKPYSGIKNISAWVVKDGDEASPTQSFEKLYEFTEQNPTQNKLVAEKQVDFTVDAAKNNSNNVVVYVKTIDNAGNVKTESYPLDIDVTAPIVKVEFDDEKNENAKPNCFTSRTATVTITERTNNFNTKLATEAIKITAENAKDEAVSNAYEISNWTTTEGETLDSATHTATITFKENANYTFDVEYADLAGNSAADYEKQIFTVDNVAPEGSVDVVSAEGREVSWNSVVNKLTYGFWSKSKISIAETHSDVTSKDVKVEYFVEKATTPGSIKLLTQEDLDKVEQTKWQSFKNFDVTENSEFVAYLKFTDNSGNVTYASTNGLIVDDKHPSIESVAPEITVTPEKPINGIYKDDINVAIKVVDPTVGGTYSGINKVSYQVINKAINKVTQEGVLYTFDGKNPTQSELKNVFETNIVVDSKLNNSNDVQIIVYAVDNAGNGVDNSQTNSQSYTSIKVDITAPTIDVEFDNNVADSGKYFNKDRTAKITITERNFNANNLKVSITNTDGKIPVLSTWTKIDGTTENADDSTYVATVTFAQDGDYTFNVEYTDLAGNKCAGVNYADGTVAANDFTLDKTNPAIRVTYDNNDVKNGNYYKTVRTATIEITEHNFSADRVNATVTATDDGVTKTAPKISNWSTKGDVHTATIYYSDDAKYTFDISYNDLAGNAAIDYKEDVFFVDKTVPELKITNVSNDAAYAGSVTPVVSYSDTNFDAETVKITLRGANRGEVKTNGTKADAKNGAVFTFADFEKIKSVDDIYTLTATLTDKAGNTSTETVRFSVNRFGSTYELSKSLKKYNGAYVQSVEDVVITEVNANRLENIKLTLFKNSETIVLKENTDYKVTVNGGGGSWYSYTYTVFKSVFSDDGVYRLSIHSEDAAGNVAENTLDTKDKEISFGIDTTLPNIVVANLEKGETYPEAQKEVKLSVNDNMLIETLTVYFDDNETPFASWTAKEIADIVAENGEFKFVIPGDNGEEHKVRIVCVDAAGNVQEQLIDEFYVTTNKFVQFYNNKALFFGSIGGGVSVTALAVFFIVKKRKL